MNVKIFFYISVILFLLTGSYWLVQHPYFRIAQIDIQAADSGSLKRAQIQSVFEAVRPELTGSFFTIDLQQAKKRALAQAWVKDVNIDRIAPNQVKLSITEYEAAARWIRDNQQAGLLAPDGAVFQAASEEMLPELDGEFKDLLLMLEHYQVFEARIRPLRLNIKRLQYKPYGAWTLMLSNGIEVRLGQDNIHTRLARFIDLWPRQLATQAAYIDYVDVRYPHGVAIKRRADAPAVTQQEIIE